MTIQNKILYLHQDSTGKIHKFPVETDNNKYPSPSNNQIWIFGIAQNENLLSEIGVKTKSLIKNGKLIDIRILEQIIELANGYGGHASYINPSCMHPLCNTQILINDSNLVKLKIERFQENAIRISNRYHGKGGLELFGIGSITRAILASKHMKRPPLTIDYVRAEEIFGYLQTRVMDVEKRSATYLGKKNAHFQQNAVTTIFTK